METPLPPSGSSRENEKISEKFVLLKIIYSFAFMKARMFNIWSWRSEFNYAVITAIP
jgi:hypothetical protein